MDHSYNYNYDYNQHPQPQSRNNHVSYYKNGVFHGKGPSFAYEIQTPSEPTDDGTAPLNGNIFADGILPQFAVVIKEKLPNQQDSGVRSEADLRVSDEKSKPFDVESTQAKSYRPTQKPRQRTEMLGVPAVPNAPDKSYYNNSDTNENTTNVANN